MAKLAQEREKMRNNILAIRDGFAGNTRHRGGFERHKGIARTLPSSFQSKAKPS